ncbi:signal transduction histidine kinase [Bradyrhizobium sp. USDA 4454]
MQTIMRLHGGRIEADQAPSGGACMRMVFAEVQQGR